MSANSKLLAGMYCANMNHSFDGTRLDENGKCPKCEAQKAKVWS